MIINDLPVLEIKIPCTLACIDCYLFQQMAIYSPVTAFLLLISSALVLDTAIYFRRHEMIVEKDWKSICDYEPCGNVEAAGVSWCNAGLSTTFQVAGKNF